MTQPQILNKDDVRTAGGIVHSDGNVFFTNIEQLNAAVLAKLAGAEVPEPEILRTDEVDRYGDTIYVEAYTLDQLLAARAAAYLRGQQDLLSKRPFGYLCDWGNNSYGLTRQTIYYGEPGSATEDNWSEFPKVHCNLRFTPS